MSSDDGVLEFSSSKLTAHTLAVFEEMRKKGEQVDVTIKVGDRVFPVHKLVLSAAIPYFRTMFGSNMAESTSEEVIMKETDPVTLGCLIDYAYTGNVKITPGNVESLLATSEYLQISEVKNACAEFLSKRLDSSNVMIIQKLAEKLNCPGLVQCTNTYIRENFEPFCQREEFLSLPFFVVDNLIREDDLRVENEEKVFEAVVKWVKADPERMPLLPQLLTGVRMPLLSNEYLVKNVSNLDLIQQSGPCKNLVDEAKNCRLLPNDPSVCHSFSKKPRLCNLRTVCYDYNPPPLNFPLMIGMVQECHVSHS